MKTKQMSSSRLDLLVLFAALVFIWPTTVSAQPTSRTYRVLALYWDNKDFPGNIKFDESFKAVLQANHPGEVEYYPEYMETTRFPGQNQAFFHEYLRQKYAGRKIDVVVATADIPLNFLLQYRADLFPTSPIVFVTNHAPSTETLGAGPGATGIVHQSTHQQTLNLALSLHPNTNQVFVISGSPEHDKRFEKSARQELGGFENRVRITYLTDLPLSELITRTANLPPRSIALYVWQQAFDEQGRILETYEVLGRIAPSSAAPIYGMGSGNVGQGIVGGYLQGPDSNGSKTAEIALRILNGTRAQDIPVANAPTVATFDWRELRRWGINERSLPPNSVIKFREVSFWESYKWYVVGLVAAVIVEGLLILRLLFTQTKRRQAERETQRQHEIAEKAHRRLGEIVSNVPGIVWETIIDPVTKERKPTFVSDHVRKMLGFTPKEWLDSPETARALIHKEDRKRTERDYEAVLASGNGGITQFRLQTKDGGQRWAETHLSPISDGDHKIVGLRGVTLDITERKLAEEAVRKTEEKDRAILNAIPDLMFLQTQDGVYLDYHVKDQRDLFVPPHEFLGKNMREILPPNLVEEFARCFERAEQFGEPQIVEYPLPVNGFQRWFEARVVRSGENILSVVRDVTQRVFTEEAIKRNEAQLAGIIGSAMDAIITVDENQRIMLFNTSAEEIFGCSTTDAIGRPFDEFLPERSRQAHHELVRQFGEQNATRRLIGTDEDLYGLRSSGEEFPMEASISQIELYGQKFYTIILRDITDRKRALDALRQSEERFAKAFQANPQPMSLTRIADGHYLHVNESFLELSGYTREEVIGRTSLELNIWETAKAREDFIDELNKRGSVVNKEAKFRTKDGSFRTFLSSAERLVLDGEECLLVASSDITERMLAQRALQESEERFRNMAETAPVMIWVTDPYQTCTYVNKSWLEFTGRPIEQELGRGWADVIHPDDVEPCLAKNSAAFDGRHAVNLEFRARRADGKYRWILSHGTPRFSTDGEFLGYIGSCLDITERRESEQALRTAHEELHELKNQLEAENIYLQEELRSDQTFGEIVGESDAIRYVLFKVSQVALTDSTVLITGETGTGKELVARAIHSSSSRKDRPLIKVNCAALPASLIESELFGHEKGAFTGAVGRKPGRFELANGGTIFLDEIGELPLESQVRLLRVIQEGEFERLGSTRTIKVDVRIIAATNRNLKLEVEKGTFREDLWYRLNVFPITVPPLRQRPQDIPLLVEHFVGKYSKKFGKTITSISPRTMQTLQAHYWPGNVREMANVIERSVIHTQGSVLHLADRFEPPPKEASPSPKSLEEVEREYIIRILENAGWRIEGPHGAAKTLGLNPSTLRTRMIKLGIHKASLSAGR